MHDVDVVTPADVAALDGRPGPCVSLYLPTHRYGPDVRQGPILLRNLLSKVRAELDETGWRRPDVDDLLQPFDDLVDQGDFWQHQAAGLALFGAPGFSATYRLAIEVAEQVSVGDSFRVAQLVPALSGDGRFFLLALSQSDVRLFEASRHRIEGLELPDTPRSIDEALAHEDPERQLQLRSTGRGTAQFHGHGGGDEVEKGAVERYLRLVAAGVDARLRAAGDLPLVLASVAYYLPMFKAASDHPFILEDVVEGNPDRRSPGELHELAWPLVESVLSRERERQIARYRDASATGLAVDDADAVVRHAQEGRVELLFVSVGSHDDPRVDQAVGAVLGAGGRLLSAPDPPGAPGRPLAALLRY